MTSQTSFFNAVQWQEKYPEKKLNEISTKGIKCLYCCQIVDDMDKHWIDHAERWIEYQAKLELEQESKTNLGSVILESKFTKAGSYERTQKHGSEKLQMLQSTFNEQGKKKLVQQMLNNKEVKLQAKLIQKNIDHAMNQTKRFEPIGKAHSPLFLINTVNDNTIHADRITIAHDVKSIEVLSL